MIFVKNRTPERPQTFRGSLIIKTLDQMLNCTAQKAA